MNLNNLTPSALRAAMRGGVAGWGVFGSASEHVRFIEPISKSKARRRCSCGCGGRATHLGVANGCALVSGCELSIHRWVKTGDRNLKKMVPNER